jgi:hypothetical protein
VVREHLETFLAAAAARTDVEACMRNGVASRAA